MFANNTRNKQNLRKRTALPEPGDTCKDTEHKIHRALLSSAGTWEVAPSDKSVKQLLVTLKLLHSEDDPRERVFDAMKLYAQRKQLAGMKTYNGYAWQINHHCRQCSRLDADRRDVIESASPV